MEGDFNWHAKVPTDAQLAEAVAELALSGNGRDQR
jgi:hypothetical protein